MAWGKKRKSKAGKVYFMVDKPRKSVVYTGQTKRSVYTRAGEHIRNSSNTRPRLIGSIYSTNRHKAERTIKKLPSRAKRSLARKGARQYKRKRSWF